VSPTFCGPRAFTHSPEEAETAAKLKAIREELRTASGLARHRLRSRGPANRSGNYRELRMHCGHVMRLLVQRAGHSDHPRRSRSGKDKCRIANLSPPARGPPARPTRSTNLSPPHRDPSSWRLRESHRRGRPSEDATFWQLCCKRELEIRNFVPCLFEVSRPRKVASGSSRCGSAADRIVRPEMPRPWPMGLRA